MDNTTPRLEMEQQVERVKPSFMEELSDFIIELWEMIKEDFRNSINFISSNRNYFYSVAFLAVLLQFSTVTNLGTSFEKYCSKNIGDGGKHDSNSIIMKGGNDEAFTAQTFQQVQAAKKQAKQEAKADEKAQQTKQKLEKKIEKKLGDTKKVDKMADKLAADSGGILSKEQAQAEAKKKITEDVKQKQTDKMTDKARKQSVKRYEQKESQRHEQDQFMKANEERLSFFESIKKKMKGLSPGSMGGPLFGNLDLIFSSVKDIFYIVMVLLVIAGVLSLPVLVFLILTYYVFKTLATKFFVL